MRNRPQIAAIVLAAGRSTRMGDVNKLLADFDGRPMIVQTLAALSKSDLAEILVVTGHQQSKIRDALKKFEPRFVENTEYRKGLSTSLKAGVRALGSDVQGVLVVLADMPLVETGVVNQLIECFEKNSDICTPDFKGRRGNPVLWGRDYFDQMLKLDGDSGAKTLLNIYQKQIKTVDVETDSVLRDFDLPTDFGDCR